MNKQKVWTEKCPQCKCFMPDGYRICDYCLRADYGLNGLGHYDVPFGVVRYYEEDDVLRAIRLAERQCPYLDYQCCKEDAR